MATASSRRRRHVARLTPAKPQRFPRDRQPGALRGAVRPGSAARQRPVDDPDTPRFEGGQLREAGGDSSKLTRPCWRSSSAPPPAGLPQPRGVHICTALRPAHRRDGLLRPAGQSSRSRGIPRSPPAAAPPPRSRRKCAIRSSVDPNAPQHDQMSHHHQPRFAPRRPTAPPGQARPPARSCRGCRWPAFRRSSILCTASVLWVGCANRMLPQSDEIPRRSWKFDDFWRFPAGSIL